MRVTVDHTRCRQLIDGSPWIFWRERPDGEGKEGLVLTLEPCENRECGCREVRVSAQVVGSGLMTIEEKNDRIRYEYRAGEGPATQPRSAEALIAFETGELLAPNQGTSDAGSTDADVDADLFAWIRSELDGEALDKLYDEWLHAKSWRRRSEHVEGAWAKKRGFLVAWCEAFPDSREDAYILGNKYYAVDELYCLESECDCNEVRIIFLEATGPHQRSEIGAGVYNLETGKLKDLAPIRKQHGQVVQKLWSAVQTRHPALSARLAPRMARMKQVGIALGRTSEEPQASHRIQGDQPNVIAKTGRNAPCPCGSGKKYKKCCLVRE